MEWGDLASEKAARYARGYVMLGNTAYATGLALLMAGDPESARWLRRAAARWRESWDAGAPRDAWGRPVGALKASLLAGDAASTDELARWTLELGTATVESPIGRYAAALALLALQRWPEAQHVAATLRDLDDFPQDVAGALGAVAAGEAEEAGEAIRSVVRSFETREEYLEDVPVADTALVLALLAGERGLELALPRSSVLPRS